MHTSSTAVKYLEDFVWCAHFQIILYSILATCLFLLMAPQLLSNITCWGGLLSSASIQQLSVDGIVNRYLLLSLQNCPIDNYTVEKTKSVSIGHSLLADCIHESISAIHI